MAKLRAFTLLELLVVLATVVILAGVLFPVFSTAKSAAIKTACIGHFRQVGQALTLYVNDYDQQFVPINHVPGGPSNSKNDRTWVQLLLPYTKGSFALFMCPGDTTDRPRPEATFDKDLIPGDLYSEYYTASQRSNVGYNFQYLAPVVKVDGQWLAEPKMMDSLPNPAKMLMFIDSVWAVQNGRPTGGGSWLVSPPCRYEESGKGLVDTITELAVGSSSGGGGKADETIYAPVVGWDPQVQDSQNMYGGAWPWHLDRVNVCSVAMTARSVTLDQLGEGCHVQPEWTGNIYDRGSYAWSPLGR